MIASEVPPREHERCGCPACSRAHRARHAPRPDWPVDPETGRPICTTAQPMPPYAPGQWLHPEAVCTGSCSSGCCDDYECPACGTSWRTELPE